MAGGWMIGVMVDVAGEPETLRHFFAVGHPDRSNAEWKAIDRALLIGRVATGPVSGLEPVHALKELSAQAARKFALKAGEVRSLGWRWPRGWMSL